jgi:hypothetical protein
MGNFQYILTSRQVRMNTRKFPDDLLAVDLRNCPRRAAACRYLDPPKVREADVVLAEIRHECFVYVLKRCRESDELADCQFLQGFVVNG